MMDPIITYDEWMAALGDAGALAPPGAELPGQDGWYTRRELRAKFNALSVGGRHWGADAIMQYTQRGALEGWLEVTWRPRARYDGVVHTAPCVRMCAKKARKGDKP